MSKVYELTFTARNYANGEFEPDFDVTYSMAWEFDTHEESLSFAETVTPEMVVELENEGHTNAGDQYTAVYTIDEENRVDPTFDVIDEYIWINDVRIEG